MTDADVIPEGQTGSPVEPSPAGAGQTPASEAPAADRVVEAPVRDADAPGAAPDGRKLVLNVGSGPAGGRRLHPLFQSDEWREIRFDIDPTVRPDVTGDLRDIARYFKPASVDAVYSSHNFEHLETHEVGRVFADLHTILKPHGYLLATTPDLEAVARFILEGKLDDTIYESPAGPVRPLDMLFGFNPAIARGNSYMSHRTGFTVLLMAKRLLDAGFVEVRANRGLGHDLWAFAAMSELDAEPVIARLREIAPQIWM